MGPPLDHQKQINALFSRRRCATCGARMTGTPNNGRHAASERTRGHVAPSSHGGPRVWLPQCRRCNMDQGSLYLRQWISELEADGDPRAPIALASMRALESAGIPYPGSLYGIVTSDSPPAGER